MSALTRQAARDLLARWQRLEMHVRCGLSPLNPGCVRVYVHAGLLIARHGLRPPLEVHGHMLQTLLRSARDESLSWFWRSVCLENVNLPLAKLSSLLGGHESLMARELHARVCSARDEHPLSASLAGTCPPRP